MAISWKRNAAHAPASAHLPVAVRHRAISRKGRRALRIREKYLSRGGFLRCVRVKSPHSGRNDIMGQCVHRCHFDRSDSGVEKSPAEETGRRVPAPARLPAATHRRQGAPAGKSSTPVPTLWQNVVGAFLIPPAGSHRWQVGDARTYLRQNVVVASLSRRQPN